MGFHEITFPSISVKVPLMKAISKAVSVVTLLFICESGLCATYFVAPHGSNRAGNGSEAQPWQTLQYTANRVQPGDTVYVQDGDYAPFHITLSGKPQQRIAFLAKGQNVVINGVESFDERLAGVSILASYITLEGFTIQVGASSASRKSRGIRVSGEPGEYVYDVHLRSNQVSNAGWVGITTSYAENVVIEKNRVWGSKGQHGIYVANSADNPVIRDNVSFDNRQAGIQINADPELPGDGIISGADISGNILYQNGKGGSAALNLASVRNSRIYNNLIYNNFSQGMASWDDEAGVKYGCKDNLYMNNTIVMPPQARHTVSFRNGSTRNVLKNNILLHLGGKDSISVDESSLPGLVSDHNLVTNLEIAHGEFLSLKRWRDATGQDKNSTVGDPEKIFSDLSRDDYSLRRESMAIDRGTVQAAVTHDIIGILRPQGSTYDIGAYEFSTAAFDKTAIHGATPSGK